MVGLKPRRVRRIEAVSGQDHLTPKQLKTGQRLGVHWTTSTTARARKGQRHKVAARRCIGPE
jgi:hypothetical protein